MIPTRCSATKRVPLPPAVIVCLAACSEGPRPGEVLDGAGLAGRDAGSFPHATEDCFHVIDSCLEF
ncbi:hypothetical protein [Variovorax soli]|uniref:Secreted protein n=1 Tax=Variovorax soli TaxID=376815 RepID=A0ABU1NH89_9BURK|nr:hypothetical protein [Variovorax soli]MDR6537822.1 hypothetical protein [Variovorax soli]